MASGNFFTRNVKVTDVLAECYGKKACHQIVMASGAFSTSPASEKSWDQEHSANEAAGDAYDRSDVARFFHPS
jgi:hypothetical protein